MKKIAMIVNNPCAPDHRVVKQAEFLALQGHNVRIYCTAKPGVPAREVVNGVEYYRIGFNVAKGLREMFSFGKKRSDVERRERVADLVDQHHHRSD